MSPEEAIQSLESRGASGDWRPWRKTRAEAVMLLQAAPAEALEPFVPRLRDICLKSTDSEAQKVSALLLVRYCAATGQLEPVQSLAATMTYTFALFEGLRDAVKLGVDVWPLVQPLLPAHADRLDQVLARLLLKWPERLNDLPPELVMKTIRQMGVWQDAPLVPFIDVVIDTYLEATDKTKEEATLALRMTAAQPAPIPTERLAERLASARADESRLLAWVLLLERLKRKQDLEPLLTDPRPLVRLGAYEALARDAEQWTRFAEGLLDPDPQVRARVLEFARSRIEEGKPFDDGLGRRVIESGHEELQPFISFVATKYPALKEAWAGLSPPKLRSTLEAKATRACARCRSIPREKLWSHESDAPRALSQLQRSGDLLRCPDCWAHFVYGYWEEYDVNSKREEWSLRRLKLSELEQRPDFDPSHPRVATWEEALENDAHHIEPSVRDEAKWELGE
jgi:hypothetical protein